MPRKADTIQRGHLSDDAGFVHSDHLHCQLLIPWKGSLVDADRRVRAFVVDETIRVLHRAAAERNLYANLHGVTGG